MTTTQPLPPLASTLTAATPRSANLSPPAAVGQDVRRGMTSLTDQVVVSATSFLTLMLIARLCTVAEVGVFHLAWTVVGFLRTTQERMLSNPYLVFVHQTGQDEATFLGSSLFFQAVFAAACSVLIGLASMAFLWLREPAGLGAVLLVFIAAAPFILLRDHVRAICGANFRFELALAMDICVCLLQLGGIIGLAATDTVSIHTATVAMGVACFVPTFFWLQRRPQPFRVQRDRLAADWRDGWSYARWLVLARAVGIGGFYVIPWLIVWFVDSSAAGRFATCSNLVGLSLMFIMGANNYFQPRTVKAFHEAGVRAMLRSLFETIAILLVVLGLVALCFFWGGGWLLAWIYGPSYAGYGSVVFLLSLSMLAVCVSIASGNGLAALGKPRGYFWGELAYCVVAIFLAWWLIPRYGLNGAAISLIGGGLAASVITAGTLARLVAIERRREPISSMVGEVI